MTGVITEKVANYALDLLDVDKYGLDHIDRSILLTMIEKFQGGPVGLDTLAASILKMPVHWKMSMNPICSRMDSFSVLPVEEL